MLKKIIFVLVFSFQCLLFTDELSAQNADLQVYISEYPPFCFTKDGKPTGLAVEAVTQMMKNMNVSYNIRSLPWKRAYIYLLNGPNVMLFTVTRTQEREKLFKWVGPIMTSKVVFFSKKDSGLKIGSLEDAKKVERIGTVKGYATETFLLKEGFFNLVAVAGSEGENPNRLMNGRIDLWATDDVVGIYDAKLKGIDPTNMEIVYTIAELPKYMAFSKMTDDITVQKWQAALDAIKRNGSLENIVSKWSQ